MANKDYTLNQEQVARFAFVAKGIPLGIAIAFMMAIIGLSIPEATMLKKVMTWRLIGIFFVVVTLLIIISGYLFNWIL